MNEAGVRRGGRKGRGRATAGRGEKRNGQSDHEKRSYGDTRRRGKVRGERRENFRSEK